jgi:carbon monoxide dehydrogenase subunit G
MKIELEKTLALPVNAATGWSLVENIEDIAACMPGAKIAERVDDTHYKGTMTVKLGPATVVFRGELQVVAADPATKFLHVLGKGADTTGGSGASLDLTARVQETGAQTCELSGRSEVNVTGKVAAFGARLMNTVTDQLLKIFFANVLAKAEALQTSAPPPVAAAKLNAFAFLWGMLKDFVCGLFGRMKAG